MNRGGFVFLFRYLRWRIDPNSFRGTFRFGDAVDESLRSFSPGLLERLFAPREDFLRLPIVQRCRCHHSNSAVIMFVVVPVKKSPTESQRIFVTTKTPWEIGTIFHRFELAFRKRIVVGYMRSTVAFGDAQ